MSAATATTVAFDAGAGRQAALLRSRRWRGPIEAAINAASLPRSTVGLIKRARPSTAAELDAFVCGDRISADGAQLGAAAAALAPTSARDELAGERLTAWRVLRAAATGATLTLADPNVPGPPPSPPPPAPLARTLPESFSLSAEVPGLRIEHLGLFFGKGGQNIRHILSQHWATLDVKQDSGDEDAAPSFAGRPSVTLTVSSRVSAGKVKKALKALKLHAEDCAVKYSAAQAWRPSSMAREAREGYNEEVLEPGTKAYKAAAAAAGRCGGKDYSDTVHINPAGARAIRLAERVAPHAVHHFKADDPLRRLLIGSKVTWPTAVN